MSHNLTRIERLDWAAKAIAMQREMHWRAIIWIWYPLLIMAHDFSPNHRDIAVMVGAGATATAILLLRRRYAILAMGVAFVSFGAMFGHAALLRHHSLVGWMLDIVYCLGLICL